ncbi:hypothetical protein R50073_24330 [Maricurvus nonylphenolicus]|uniref:DUF7673 family protein n=1 Tax=Maricurvus nonylphenolicus TaxID=1008307 RepID=UPI0036F30EBB
MSKDEAVTAYAGAINRLLVLANAGGSGGRAAAQVLLSAYNGKAWQLDVTDLCLLDENNYQSALLVLHYRRALMQEPQEAIEDGDEKFHVLWEQWKRFHIDNRHKQECGSCMGDGNHWDEEGVKVLGPCRCCNGEGLITQH